MSKIKDLAQDLDIIDKILRYFKNNRNKVKYPYVYVDDLIRMLEGMKDSEIIDNIYIQYYVCGRGYITTLKKYTEAYLENKIPKDEPALNIPEFFIEQIERLLKSKKKQPVTFTVGMDDNSGIYAMTIVHDRDTFDRKIANKIIVGRIKRMRGDIRTPYDPIPDFICLKGVVR